MRILELYNKYEIMPQLVRHQLSVAGITKIITDQWSEKEIARKSVLASLLHDMGNIVKFDLSDEAQAKFQTQKDTPNIDLVYWRKVQEKYRAKYGQDAHEATIGILKAESLNEYAEYMIEEANLYHSSPTRAMLSAASYPAVMVLYADLRVTPRGVVSLDERIDDLQRRYGDFRPESKWGATLEGYVQESSKLNISTIDDEQVTKYAEELLRYEI